ncbi:hypothetical protein [Okeania sp. SIO3I5]|nr:hypothetical protein [Okeania sp. SIO3I5]
MSLFHLSHNQNYSMRNYMDSKLTLEYDRIGDIFYINKCTPYPEQESA